MKRKILLLAVFYSLCSGLGAQVTEQLSDLEYNAVQYYATKKYQPTHVHKYLIDKGNTVVTTDTLTLPFVDDFSSNELRSYKWVQNHHTDTFYNVFGTCLGNEGIKTIDTTMLTVTAWTYTFDTATNTFDSVAIAPDTFTLFPPLGCFTQTPQPVYYWHPYTRYWYNTDSARIESRLIDTPYTRISYAPVVYFAQGEPGTLWFDNYAYVNNTYPVNPPTIGVATLDGLNEFGLPYNNVTINAYGTADYLTSLPVNLQGITGADSVYLSFFYEPQGLGDYPDADDSLIVEFKEVGGIWDEVWARKGYSSTASADSANKQFQQVLIYVPQLALQNSYYHNTFQFRFKNKASLYGNNDHWHIDYVKLDKGRFETDTNIQDIAFVYPFPTILKNFTLMPADQFSNPSDLRDTIILTVRNLDRDANSNPPATNFVRGATELYPTPQIIAPDVLQTFNAQDYNTIQVSPSADYTIPQAVVDSLIISSLVFISPNDVLKQNDTLVHLQHFNSVMAYDDGSAEKSYGLTGLGLKKFAYEFNLNQPDTLAAFQVHFAQVDVNVSNLVFNFYAWDSLQMNNLNFAGTPIYSLENKKPNYIDSVNGFATYKLDSPIVVSNKLYFGWAQTDDRRLQVGYDLNSTLGRQHMYIFRNNVWQPSTISPAGSPMIRLIFDTNFWGGTSAVIGLTKHENKISVFPNPTNGIVYISSEKRNAVFDITVMNMFGQLLKQERGVEEKMDLSELMNGIYLLSVRDIENGKTYHTRVIKTAF